MFIVDQKAVRKGTKRGLGRERRREVREWVRWVWGA